MVSPGRTGMRVPSGRTVRTLIMPGPFAAGAATKRSRVHGEVVIRDLATDVGNGRVCLVGGPGDRREVGVGLISPGEDLVAVTRGVEEVDGVAAAETVDIGPKAN